MNTPQTTLRLQYVVLALVGLILAACLVGVALALSLPNSNWMITVVAVVGLFTLASLFVALGRQALANLSHYKRHVVSETQHRCQCQACGRDIVPVAAPGNGAPSTLLTPQEQILSADTLQQGFTAILVACGLGLVASLVGLAVLGTASEGVLTLPITLVFLAALFLVGLIGSSASKRKRARAQTTLSRLGPAHGCLCRWCQSPGRPV